MATSFRLPAEHMGRLNYLAKRLGKSKAQVVRQAIEQYYDEHMQKSQRSALDNLLEGGFQPIPIDLGDLADNEVKQRQVIRAKLTKKSRN